jgi:UDP-glucose 4-epimerase
MARTVLITGGAGFFGGLLKRELLAAGYTCVSVDLQPDADAHPQLTSIQGNIADPAFMESIFAKHKFDAVFHVAALLAHETIDKNQLWQANVDGTRQVAECAKKYGVKKVIYTSSNCLFAENFNRPVTEDDVPKPAEIYGDSKWEGEKILLTYADSFNAVIFRCPTITAAQRLGLLAILFEFIAENRKVWVVGSGDNRYQFIYALDLVDACIRALDYNKTMVFNIGSDNVKTMRQVYEFVIARSGSRSKVCSLPKFPALEIMKLAHLLRISPLGPYHYKMIAESFVFDTSRIKRELGWKPTKTNEEMLLEAHEHYIKEKNQGFNKNASAHRRPSAMGVIRLLKWIS